MMRRSQGRSSIGLFVLTLLLLTFDTFHHSKWLDFRILDLQHNYQKQHLIDNHDDSIMHSKANAIIIPEPEPKGTPPLCHREQLQIGHWIPELQDEPPYISRTTHLRCANYNFEEQPLQPYLSYNWMPRDKSCHFTSWNATEFCRLLPYSTVSIIGDSLSWEHYSSMLQLLGAPVRQSHQHKSRTFHMNIAQISCRADGHATRFVFRNDPRLSPQTVIDSIERDFPTVLVLNRGAHYDDDDILIQDIRNLLPTLLDWKVRCKRLDFRCHLFWRTTVPGHPGCAPSWASVSNQTRERIDWSRPATVRSFIETWIATQSNYNETTWNYHWYDFQRQNKLILNEFQLYSQTQGLEYEVLDAYDLNVLRLESHRWHQGDCLHNCYPGPMDVYSRLLLHFLKVQRSPADVNRQIQRYEEFTQKLRAAQT